MSKTVLHVDINAYFATMLQQKYPQLRYKPVGVLKDVGRSCIIAASKEAKKLGVVTGGSVKEAKLKAPNIILVPAQFAYYLDTTKKLRKIFESFSPEVDIFSLDEAFIDITTCQRYLPGYQDPVMLAQTIKKRIKQVLGEWVTCNIGISYNKFLAKLGSELAPKDSITVIDEHNKNDFLSTTDFKSVCGVGFRLAGKLHKLGFTSLYALNFVTDKFLITHFGPFWSQQLRIMANGDEPHFLQLRNHLPHMKSVGRSITGFKLTKSEDDIKSVLFNLCEEVIYKVRKMKLAGRQVFLHLYGSGGVSWGSHITLKHSLYHTDEMFYYAYHYLYRSWHRTFPIIKFAVRLSLLVPWKTLSLPLLPSRQRQERIHTALDIISNKYGLFTVHSGLLLNKHIIYPEVTGFLGDKYYQLELT